MKVEFLKRFEKDLEKLNHPATVRRLLETIDKIKEAEKSTDIVGLTKLRGFEDAYRIRIGDYRLGVFINDEAVTFARFLHRREVYRYFP